MTPRLLRSIRRELTLPVLATLLAACGGQVGSDSSVSPTPTPPALQPVLASAQVLVGRDQRVAFGVLDRDGLPVPDAAVSVQIFTVPPPGGKQPPVALGPVARAPYKGELLQGRGVYVVHQTFDHAGFYRAAVSAGKGGVSVAADVNFEVKAQDPGLALGAPAPRT